MLFQKLQESTSFPLFSFTLFDVNLDLKKGAVTDA